LTPTLETIIQIIVSNRVTVMDFEWSVDTKGYRLEHDRIVGNGGQRRRYHLDKFPTLNQVFARLQTPDDLLGFVNKFGRLTLDTIEDGQPIIGDDVRDVLANARAISGALGILHGHMGNLPRWRGGEFVIETDKVKLTGGIPLRAKLTPWLVPDPLTGKWEFQLKPPSLLDAIWLQFGQAVVGGLRQCKNPNCKREPWFRVGKGTNRGAKSEFCSDACRIEFNNSRR
jgi:hypothetical protein